MATTRKPNIMTITPPGGGPTDTPYDQTGIGAMASGLPNLPTPQAGSAANAQPPVPPASAGGQGLVAQMGAQNTDQLTGQQLGQLDVNPEDQLVQEMEQALADPQTPPDLKQAIEQQLMLAAKRQMIPGASLGGQ
jgi:hypothetical protein